MAAGDPVYSSDFSDVEARVGIRKVKAVSQQRINTSTLANDAELFDMQLTPGNYHVRVRLAMGGGAGGIPIKTRWGFTGSWNAPLRQVIGPLSSNTLAGTANPTMQRTAVSAVADATYGLGSSAAYHLTDEESMQVIVTATGMFSVQWAPNAVSATSGSVNQGSFVVIVPFD